MRVVLLGGGEGGRLRGGALLPLLFLVPWVGVCLCVCLSVGLPGCLSVSEATSSHLRDDTDFAPELEQPDGGNVHAVDDQRPGAGLHDAEDGQQEGALAAARAPHDADLLTRVDGQRQALENVGAWRIVH
jgi:hypothetical protein